MKANLFRVAQLCCFAVATSIFWGSSCRANTVTFTVNYPDSPNFSTVLNLGGTPLPGQYAIQETMAISGSGPLYSEDGDGWYAEADGTVTDNFGDSVFVYVNGCDSPCLSHVINGDFLSFTSVPTSLKIDLVVNVLYDVGGPANADATMILYLPDGMYVTPLPATLPLFATGLGALSLLGWRRKRKTTPVITA